MPKTILVADDSVTIRKVVELTFHDTDIRVESTGNGREALERIEALQPDLVLADVIMPEPSGYEICRSVKGSGHPVPVLLLTGAFEPFDPDRARECGADGHVVKPFESRALFERVEALLRESGTASDAARSVAAAAEVDALLEDLSRAQAPDAPPDAPEESVPRSTLDWLLGPEATAPAVAALHEPEPTVRAEDSAPPAWAPLASETSVPAQEPLEIALAGPTHDAPALRLSPEEMNTLVRAVVERLSDRVLREIAWDVVPNLAESIIRERIRQLEQAEPEKI